MILSSHFRRLERQLFAIQSRRATCPTRSANARGPPRPESDPPRRPFRNHFPTKRSYPMEMRLLTTEGERNFFAQRLADARARHGASFRDIGRSQARNMIRLAAADLYGLFERERDYAETMKAGVALHDLAIYPQSCQQPDLSHYVPESVLECSDHWSLSRGAGMHAWRGIAVQVVRRNPRAVLVYLAVGRSDHGGFYKAMGFVRPGVPVEYPYLEGPDQGRLWVQPMIL